MAMRYACSPFITDEDFGTLIKCECDLAGLPIDALVEQVSDVLAMLTNGTIRGRCERTIRPCAQDAGCVCGAGGWADYCSCCRLSGGLALPGIEPVVHSIRIDGTPLTEDEFVFVNGELVRVGKSWPYCQNLKLPGTEPGTFEIVYTEGDLPLFAKLAAAELTCELALEIAVAKGNQPPANWTSANLDGLTVSRDRYAADPTQAVDQFMALGLRWTAKFLNLYADGSDAPLDIWSVETGDQWRLFDFAAGSLTPADT